nr:MAG TPA: hypothetical protein [Caudoviricetes sp.]
MPPTDCKIRFIPFHTVSYSYDNSVFVSCHIIRFLFSRNKYGTKSELSLARFF